MTIIIAQYKEKAVKSMGSFSALFPMDERINKMGGGNAHHMITDEYVVWKKLLILFIENPRTNFYSCRCGEQPLCRSHMNLLPPASWGEQQTGSDGVGQGEERRNFT